MLEKRYVYGLYDVSDETKTIRYVGQAKNMKGRLSNHKVTFKRLVENNKTLSKVNKWIKDIYDNNSEIEMILLEKSNIKKINNREAFWIKKYRKTNDLFNTLSGGKGSQRYSITYKQLKKWVKENIPHITSGNQWDKESKNFPLNIPRNPKEVFLVNGWISWGDFLSTGRVQDNLIIKNYVLYEEAKKIIKKEIKAKTEKEWKELTKQGEIPNNIPNRPDRFYKNLDRGWVSWGDFLGTGRIANQNLIRLSIQDAKKWLKKLKINSIREYKKLHREDKIRKDIPSDADSYYKNRGWINWGDFLGHGREQDNKKAKKYYNYEKARKWVHKNLPEIKTREQWNKEYVKKGKIPYFIPNQPEQFYYKKNRGWKGWGDFLKNGIIAPKDKVFLNYRNAKKESQKENLKSRKEWDKFKKSEKFKHNIPKRPDSYYEEWESWGIFLGTNNISAKKKEFYSEKELYKILINNNINTWSKYKNYKKENKDLKFHSNPKIIYNNWKGIKEFLKRNTLLN